MARAKLFVDIDDTLLADCFGQGIFDLRPGVITQLNVLSRMFDCHWLTHWQEEEVYDLWDLLHANRLVDKIEYANWRMVNKNNKEDYILLVNERYSNWYWIEDPLSTGSLEKLKAAGLMDRYIKVDPKGLWGFTRALNVLFDKAYIKEADIVKAGGKRRWFREPLTSDYLDFTYYE